MNGLIYQWMVVYVHANCKSNELQNDWSTDACCNSDESYKSSVK
jgi:hypothetical protein